MIAHKGFNYDHANDMVIIESPYINNKSIFKDVIENNILQNNESINYRTLKKTISKIIEKSKDNIHHLTPKQILVVSDIDYITETNKGYFKINNKFKRYNIQDETIIKNLKNENKIGYKILNVDETGTNNSRINISNNELNLIHSETEAKNLIKYIESCKNNYLNSQYILYAKLYLDRIKEEYPKLISNSKSSELENIFESHYTNNRHKEIKIFNKIQDKLVKLDNNSSNIASNNELQELEYLVNLELNKINLTYQI